MGDRTEKDMALEAIVEVTGLTLEQLEQIQNQGEQK